MFPLQDRQGRRRIQSEIRPFLRPFELVPCLPERIPISLSNGSPPTPPRVRLSPSSLQRPRRPAGKWISLRFPRKSIRIGLVTGADLGRATGQQLKFSQTTRAKDTPLSTRARADRGRSCHRESVTDPPRGSRTDSAASAFTTWYRVGRSDQSALRKRTVPAPA